MSGWKPGDVAVVTCPNGSEHRAMWQIGPAQWACMYGQNCVSADNSQARPLITIDPEDREQVDRLADSMRRVFDRQAHRDIGEAIDVALREFTNPTPPKCDMRIEVNWTQTGRKIQYTCDRPGGHAGSHGNDAGEFEWSGFIEGVTP